MPAPDPERYPALALAVTPVNPTRNAIWRWFGRKYPHIPVGERAKNLEVLASRELAAYVEKQCAMLRAECEKEAVEADRWCRKCGKCNESAEAEIADLRLQLEQAQNERAMVRENAGDVVQSWCPACRGFLLGGKHFAGRCCGTCHTETVGRTANHLIDCLRLELERARAEAAELRARLAG